MSAGANAVLLYNASAFHNEASSSCYTQTPHPCSAKGKAELDAEGTDRQSHHLPGVVYKGSSAYSLCYLLAALQHQVGNGNGFLKHPACKCHTNSLLCATASKNRDNANKALLL